MGAGGPARSDGALARGVPVRAGGLRAAPARREHRLRLRADRRCADPLSLEELPSLEIVVPGDHDASFLALRLVLGDFRYRELPFDEIPDEVASGRADAGLLIHEGQLTFGGYGS